jgi:uncharacterized protein
MTESWRSSVAREHTLTLGVMARAPVAGRCKTRLASLLGARGAARLYEAMLLDTFDGAESLAPDRKVVVAAPEDDGLRILRGLAPRGWEVHPQHGDDLGARLANAFRDLHCDGSLVCLAGSDSPAAPWAELSTALRAPRPGGVAVVGPCEDGGYYLIGMTSLELGILEAIPWSTPRVMRATRARCAALGVRLDELAAAWDVDEPADVDRLAAELLVHPRLAPRTSELLATVMKDPAR